MTYKHICANCKWWDITDNTESYGNLEEHECHRNPPHPHYGSPRVPENHSCGEFAIANPSERELVPGETKSTIECLNDFCADIQSGDSQ